ncbi:MAG: hypothetical protein Q6K90_03845 [Gloeomargarita sp. HHBFW_bins_162]
MSWLHAFPRVERLPQGMAFSHWHTGAKLAVHRLDKVPAWVLVSPPQVSGAAKLWLDSREVAWDAQLLCVRSPQWVFALVATAEGAVAHSFQPEVVRRVWQDILVRVTDGEQLAHLKALPDHWPVAPPELVEQFYQEWLTQAVQPPEEWARSVLHEVYTPLSTIGVWTNVMLKYQRELPQRVVQGLRAIAQEVQTRQERWRSWFEPHHCQTGVQEWQAQAQAQGIDLNLQLTMPLPGVFRHVLAQVMPVLLGELPAGAQIHGTVKQTEKQQQKVIILYLHFTHLGQRQGLNSEWEWSPQTGRLYPSLTHWQKRLAALGGELHWQAQGLELTMPLEALAQQGMGDE